MTDIKALLEWALKTGELYVVAADISALTKIAKASDGQRKIDGVKITVTESFGFSGR